MVDCIACDGTGRKGIYEGYIFKCAYCNGTGKLNNQEELRSVGLRCGKIYQNAYQLQLNLEDFSKGGYRGDESNRVEP